MTDRRPADVRALVSQVLALLDKHDASAGTALEALTAIVTTIAADQHVPREMLVQLVGEEYDAALRRLRGKLL